MDIFHCRLSDLYMLTQYRFGIFPYNHLIKNYLNLIKQETMPLVRFHGDKTFPRQHVEVSAFLFRVLLNAAVFLVFFFVSWLQHTHVPRLIPLITSNCTSKSVAVRR